MEKGVESALPPCAWKRLENLKAADILVGISSYNNAHTINYVLYQAAKGLGTYFSSQKSIIFVSDGNSTDGTLEAVKAVRLPFQVEIIPFTYVGVSGKGSAVKAIFEAARFLKVKAVALVDSDLRSISPEWIKLLVSPTLTGTGLVTPFYVRHKYDGTITNFICYPVTSSLYGKKVRQPIGGDFGLSIELVEELLESPLWQTPYIPRFGIDIFETHTALAKDFDVKQAFLGTKIHEAKDPSRNLAPMFRQVVGSMFSCIELYDEAWKEVRGSHDVEIVGEGRLSMSPEAVQVDLKNLLGTFRSGFEKFRLIYSSILSEDLLKELEKMDKTGGSSETWARVVYSFIGGFKRGKQFDQEGLLDALRILWIGRVAAFVKETLELDTAGAEDLIEEEARAFERLKPYLLDIF